MKNMVASMIDNSTRVKKSLMEKYEKENSVLKPASSLLMNNLSNDMFRHEGG